MIDTANLTESERQTIDQIRSANPGGSLDNCEVLLVRYAKVVSQAETLDREIDQYRVCPTDEKELSRFQRLANMRCATTDSLLALARSLRITQHARFGPRKAARLSRGGSVKKPWEF